MKKKNFTLVCSFIMLAIFSQGQNQKSSFGITAGATFATYKAKSDYASITSKTKTGFTVGISPSFAMGQHFSFWPALNYVQKGGTFKDDYSNDKTTLNYLELPLNFVYNTTSSKGKFFVGAGPSFSMGLSGKDKWESDGGGSGSDDIKFGSSDDDDLKPFEMGINFLAGYEFKGGFLVTANYNAGVSNIANGMEGSDGTMHNRYFGVRIGYMFPGKKK